MTQADGWLVDASARRLTPSRYSAAYLKKRIEPLELIVVHSSPGPFESIVRWHTSRDSGASTHFVISKTGLVLQLAPLTERTWHAQNTAVTWRRRRQVTYYSVGIELENFGRLRTRKRPDRSVEVTTLRGDLFTADTFTGKDETLWEPYGEAQMAALFDTLRKVIDFAPALAVRTPVALPPEGPIVGHEHIDAARTDPGPAFPWAKVLKAAHR